jgi:diacylglycerol kinase (ATP)
MRKKFFGSGTPGYHPLRKVRVVLAGLRFAMLYDFSVAYKIVLSSIIIALALLFQRWVDFAMILLATGLVVTAELFNSAVEALCDFVETRENKKIRAIKDMAAAAVGVSILVWVTVVVFDIFDLTSVMIKTFRD